MNKNLSFSKSLNINNNKLVKEYINKLDIENNLNFQLKESINTINNSVIRNFDLILYKYNFNIQEAQKDLMQTQNSPLANNTNQNNTNCNYQTTSNINNNDFAFYDKRYNAPNRNRNENKDKNEQEDYKKYEYYSNINENREFDMSVIYYNPHFQNILSLIQDYQETMQSLFNDIEFLKIEHQNYNSITLLTEDRLWSNKYKIQQLKNELAVIQENIVNKDIRIKNLKDKYNKLLHSINKISYKYIIPPINSKIIELYCEKESTLFSIEKFKDKIKEYNFGIKIAKENLLKLKIKYNINSSITPNQSVLNRNNSNDKIINKNEDYDSDGSFKTNNSFDTIKFPKMVFYRKNLNLDKLNFRIKEKIGIKDTLKNQAYNNTKGDMDYENSKNRENMFLNLTNIVTKQKKENLVIKKINSIRNNDNNNKRLEELKTKLTQLRMEYEKKKDFLDKVNLNCKENKCKIFYLRESIKSANNKITKLKKCVSMSQNSNFDSQNNANSNIKKSLYNNTRININPKLNKHNETRSKSINTVLKEDKNKIIN